jgi:hypothetical protein
MSRNVTLLMAVALAGAFAAQAQAAPAQASGLAQANVVVTGSIVPVDILRFGQIVQPTSAGTLTIAVASNGAVTITPAGGVTAASIGILQTGLGRGAGMFELTGSPNRQTTTTLPTSITISNGAQTMTVNNFSANTNGGGKLKLDATGHAQLLVGARLNVGANQVPGNYSGTYTITVAFQ